MNEIGNGEFVFFTFKGNCLLKTTMPAAKMYAFWAFSPFLVEICAQIEGNFQGEEVKEAKKH
jgi:hypothetical protein